MEKYRIKVSAGFHKFLWGPRGLIEYRVAIYFRGLCILEYTGCIGKIYMGKNIAKNIYFDEFFIPKINQKMASL
jgi:hypothetical protein